MFRLAWATDIHLNCAEPEALDRFLGALAEAVPDALALAGDIAEAASLEGHLLRIAEAAACPVYFVLGNHDFYGGAIAGVRAAMAALTRRSDRLRWLPGVGAVPLTGRTALLGHGGWGDGRLGDGDRSDLLLNDDFLIQELAWLEPADRVARLRALGDEAAAFVRETLARALGWAERAVLVTHVPPFAEACCYEDGLEHDADVWLPRFACKAVGDVLIEIMAAHPDRALTVLCGHTHGHGAARIAPNLEVFTGGAEYGAPALQGILELP